MATLLEMSGLLGNDTLLGKITGAVLVQAEAVRAESGGTANNANRRIWAKQAFQDPRAMAARMISAIVAQNAGFTLAQINGASDAAILASVALAVDIFATGA